MKWIGRRSEGTTDATVDVAEDTEAAEEPVVEEPPAEPTVAERKASLRESGWEFDGAEDCSRKGNGSVQATLGGTLQFSAHDVETVLDAVERWQNEQAAKKPGYRSRLYQGS